MGNFNTAVAAENEIMKATDVTFGYDSTVNNIATALRAVISNSDGNYAVGGYVKPYGSGGLNVSIAPVYAYCNSTGICVAETGTTEPVSFEEADSELDRTDIVEVCGMEELYDQQQRKFNDPATGTKTTQKVATKKRIALSVRTKPGTAGSEAAPETDSGYVKLAEVRIPAGANRITADLIKNITARKYGEENTGWTADKSGTFNPGYIADILRTFLVDHNEDGSHRDRVIKSADIDFGTGSIQVKGTVIPAGQSMSLHGADFISGESLTNLIGSLVANANSMYHYSNDLISRFDFIRDLPAAASTENIDIAEGGEKVIDGVTCTVGNTVLLKDQDNAVENGLWEVQSGAWTRYSGYSAVEADAFTHKLVFVPAGNANRGKVYYLSGDFNTIGTDPLNFIESNLSHYGIAHTVMTRDKNGRAQVAAPSSAADIARKAEVDAEASARASAVSTVQTNLNTHTSNKSNPHSVTKAQVGLGSVPNVATNDQTPTYSAATSLATLTSGEKLTTSMGKIMRAITDFIAHLANKSNPHGVTKAQVGLGNCNNTADSAKSVSYASSAGNSDTVDGHHFHWSGQSGQPTWMWGGNDSTNQYVYNPTNFSVKYATSAGNANTVDGYHAGTAAGQLIPVSAFNFGTSTGYIKLGNGLIMQYGYVCGTSAQIPVTMPLSYSKFYSAVATSNIYATGHPIISRTSLSGFNIANTTYNNTWIAIGY